MKRQLKCEGDVVICFLDLQCYIVWIGKQCAPMISSPKFLVLIHYY